MEDQRPTSQKIAHRTVATIGIVLAIVIAIPVLCGGILFLAGVFSVANEAMDNAAREANANATPRPSNQNQR